MRRLSRAAGILAAAFCIAAGPVSAADPENTLYLELDWGRVVIEMRPELAPRHVARVRQLARQKFYDGLAFHRVIRGFMAQTGDPRGDGTGGSGVKLRAEFTDARHDRGTVSMARAQSPDSADSQFFIVLDDAPHLNGQYTVWGKVVEGMEHVDRIKKGLTRENGVVRDPDRIKTMRIAADMEE